MKSCTSPTPSGVRNRVIRTLVSGKYSCLIEWHSWVGSIRQNPPFSASSIDANTLGESNRGQQHQPMVPSVPTSATVWRLPITPCSAIGR